MAYRGDLDALVAQCDSLRRELDRAESDAHELERLHRELASKTRELEQLRAQIDPALIRRSRWRTGVVISALVTVGAVAWLTTQRDRPFSSAAWFAAARAHCNPLEARDQLARSRPPDDPQAPGYLATCWALAGDLDEARRVLQQAGPRRSAALSILFEIAHPIADRGDDRAAGPIMGLVVEMWPQNYMAWYHAGMSDYAGGDAARAKQRLETFLSLYAPRDGWRSNAENALSGIATGRTFALVFAGKRDPRIE
jgi:hypothetical protein